MTTTPGTGYIPRPPPPTPILWIAKNPQEGHVNVTDCHHLWLHDVPSCKVPGEAHCPCGRQDHQRPMWVEEGQALCRMTSWHCSPVSQWTRQSCALGGNWRRMTLCRTIITPTKICNLLVLCQQHIHCARWPILLAYPQSKYGLSCVNDCL